MATSSRDYVLRTPTAGDLPAVQELLDACESADVGEPCPHDMDIVAFADTSKLDLERSAWLAVAPDSALAGVAWLWVPREGDTELVGDHYVHPEHRIGPVDDLLIDALETRAREVAPAAAAASRLVLFCESSNPGRRRSLVERDYEHARDFYGMRIDLGPGRPAAQWPPGIEVRAARPGHDDRALHAACDDAFSEHYLFAPTPFEDFVRCTFRRSGFDASLYLAAWDGEEVTGQVWAVPAGSGAVIEDLSVRRQWRGRGLGLALLLEIFRLLGDRGLSPVRLFVDVQNITGALRVYERAGMRVERRLEALQRVLG